MSIRDILVELLKNLEGEIDFYYDETTLYLWVLYFSLLIIINAFIWFKARISLNQLEDLGPGGKSFIRVLLGLTILPIGVFMGYIYRIVTENAVTLFPSTKNFFFPVALGLLGVTQLTVYAREVINVSNLASRIYRTVYLSVLGISFLLFFLMILNSFDLIAKDYVRFLFVIVGSLYAITLVMIVLFSAIDYFRTSNKLTKVRLGMTTIAASLIFVQGVVIVLYSYAVQSGNLTNLIPLFTFTIYGLVLPSALAIYWGYIIPEKIQIWTGILPPSFLELKQDS